MPRYIMQLEEYYLEWSTVVDAPVSWGMSLEEFKEYYRQEYGHDGMRGLDDRLKRVAIYGTSSHDRYTPDDLIRGNHAGPNESELTREQIYHVYCLRQPLNEFAPRPCPNCDEE
jgi:hypothetical protein